MGSNPLEDPRHNLSRDSELNKRVFHNKVAFEVMKPYAIGLSSGKRPHSEKNIQFPTD
jgi:hypothetical protein